ncbi:hypothetical protein VNI00_006778 [Paramarasmius palmivorus]|uniref:Uncharacterized protein n=1 Tax=Paramarasmius palmivorus TaxID=297713 RepID=A0AAW0D848_9AGAR
MAQLDGDSLLQCLETYLNRSGNQQASGLLILTKSVGARLYPTFYRNVFLLSSRNLYPFLATLTKYPERCRFVNTIWIRMGRDNSNAPALKDSTYPRNYPSRHFLPVYISRRDIQSLSKALSMVSGTLTRLTIAAGPHYPTLRGSLAAMDFPNLVELEVAVDLILLRSSGHAFEGIDRCLKLCKLRLVYSSEDGTTEVLPYQDFTQLKRLTHLYISYWSESRIDVEHSLVNLRVPDSVKVVVLEQDAGLHLPIRFDSLGHYTIHPRVVFVMEKGILEQFNRVLGHTPRMRTVHGSCLVLDRATIREDYMWEKAEQKVHERWTLFNRIPPSILLRKWTDGRVIYKLQ